MRRSRFDQTIWFDQKKASYEDGNFRNARAQMTGSLLHLLHTKRPSKTDCLCLLGSPFGQHGFSYSNQLAYLLWLPDREQDKSTFNGAYLLILFKPDDSFENAFVEYDYS